MLTVDIYLDIVLIFIYVISQRRSEREKHGDIWGTRARRTEGREKEREREKNVAGF